jgi:hypothetical protein
MFFQRLIIHSFAVRLFAKHSTQIEYIALIRESSRQEIKTETRFFM